MKRPNEKIILAAVSFAERWGFLTQSLFFEFLCPLRHVQSYEYWSHLVRSGLFIKSKSNTRTLILSHKARLTLGDSTRPARSHFYIQHDEVVARLFLALELRGLIIDSWLEDELIRNPIEAYSVLGTQRLHRLPDVVFDLRNNSGSPIRCALEIERTTKSEARYRKMALAYLNCSKVSVVLVGCSHRSTAESVRKAFNSDAHIESKRTPGTFVYESFDPENLSIPIRFQNNEMPFEKFLEVVTKGVVPKITLGPKKLRTVVRSFEDAKAEAS
jgi:hypothetical protein